MDEVDVDAVDVRRELRQGIELCFGLAPVVVRAPITNEFLELRQLHALPLIGRGLLVRPARRLEAAAEVRQISIGHADAERHHLGVVVFSSGRCRRCCAHSGRGEHGKSHAARGCCRECENHHCGNNDDSASESHPVRQSFESFHAVLLGTHETRRAAWDLSDEGIDDTFV